MEAPPKACCRCQGQGGEKGIVPGCIRETQQHYTTNHPTRTQAKQDAKPQAAAKPKAAEDEEDDLDEARYREVRLATVAAIKAKGGNPYPHKFHTTCRIPEYITKYTDSIEAGTVLDTETVSLAGRLWTKRASGAKLVFYDVHGDGAKVQIMADARHSELDAEGFGALHAASRRGDIVGVVGHPARTKKGELSIVPVHFEVLSPCLHQLPKGPTGIKNQVSCCFFLGGGGLYTVYT